MARNVLLGCGSNPRSSIRGRWCPSAGESNCDCFVYQVLSDFVQKGDMTERQAIGLTKKALFENANRVYNLGLKPGWGK